MFAKTYSFALLFALLVSCQQHKGQSGSPAVGPDGWLKGTTDEKLDEVAHQLGGFSRTMAEVGYRYSELYWAGQDENWQYANHQIEHILEAMEDGLKRRPVREASAREFMKKSIPAIWELVERENKEAFLEGFKTFTAGCNHCHVKEGETFIVIQEPLNRTSPVRF
ncbi:hypothetical protein [Negadavirga shengliensis]|uniref:Cytochrome c domain-containing protein n=1 Tax=Negadavirga shengliensis TaxID=1389218 RepID=A0ABV9SYY7_9BACT